MSSNRNQAARELLAFYLEAGVDAVLGEAAVDRFADTAEISPPPAIAPPPKEVPRRNEPEPRGRPDLDLSRPSNGITAAPIPLSPDLAVMAAREEAKN